MSDKLRLIEIAEGVSINPVYVSSVVKADNGKTFINTIENMDAERGLVPQYVTNKTYEETIRLLTE
jgi:YesN/AraC family two-component response regulator